MSRISPEKLQDDLRRFVAARLGGDDLQFQVCPRTKPEGEQGKDRRHQREHAGDTTAANRKTLSFFLAFGVLSRDNLVAPKNLDDNEEGEIARRIERALRDRRQILAPTLAATSWRYVLLLRPGAQIFAAGSTQSRAVCSICVTSSRSVVGGLKLTSASSSTPRSR
jgi:hypothetical protein